MRAVVAGAWLQESLLIQASVEVPSAGGCIRLEIAGLHGGLFLKAVRFP